MKSILLIVTLFTILDFTALAQFETNETHIPRTSTEKSAIKNQSRPLQDNLVVGGGFDLRFGNYTMIGVTPLIGYAVTDDFLVGGIFTYRYVNDKMSKYSTSTYGVAPFARYFVYQGLFAHAEYEMLNGEFYYKQGNVWVNSLLVGLGYGSRIGEKGFIGFYALWNLTEKEDYRIYNQPTFRFSFGIGL